MANLLLIVLRTEPDRYVYLKHILGSETVDVTLDRRVKERRRRQTPVVVERRPRRAAPARHQRRSPDTRLGGGDAGGGGEGEVRVR